MMNSLNQMIEVWYD